MPNNRSLAKELWRGGRFLLREKSAGWGVTICFSIGLAMIYGDDFAPGIIFLVLAGSWGIGAWQVSEELQKRKPQQPTKQKYARIQRYKLDRRGYLVWKFSIPCGIVAALALSAVFVNKKRDEKLLREYEGFLLPATDPDVPSFCSEDQSPEFLRQGKDMLKVFIGRNEAVASRFPYVVLQVRGKDRMIIDRDAAGKLALSVDILDAAGKVIVTFEKGHFTVVQANILDMKRPDRSTLIVRDHFKSEVLNIRFLNSRSVQFSGLLRYPEFGTIAIPKSTEITGTCVKGGGVAYGIN